MWWRDWRQHIRDVLDPCEPTRDDLDFLFKWLPRSARAREAMLLRYREIWLLAMEREPQEVLKQNRGRYAANCWIRNAKRGPFDP